MDGIFSLYRDGLRAIVEIKTEGIVTAASMGNESFPEVVCIIVNWNGWRDTISCLSALKATDYDNFSVLVIDNGSTDGSVEKVRQAFPDVEIIENAVNSGFGAANNLGMRRAVDRDAQYVWLLNNDTVVGPETLRELVATAEADKTLGAVGSILYYADFPDKIQAWGGGYVNLWMGTSHHFHGPVPWGRLDYLTAASILLPVCVLKQVGLFDEQYFMYWEDTDLSFRIRSAGWKLGVAERARLLHKEGSSMGAKSAIHDEMVTVSGIKFLRKHSKHGFISMIFFVGIRSLKRLVLGNVESCLSVIRAYRLS